MAADTMFEAMTMSSRLPIRARVLRRGNRWLVIMPSGRRVETMGNRLGWALAMTIARRSVREERKYAALKAEGQPEYPVVSRGRGLTAKESVAQTGHMTMPQRHERETITQKAGTKIELALLELQEKHDLTDVEMLQIVHSWQQTKFKYMLRFERHGNYEKPGGLA